MSIVRRVLLLHEKHASQPKFLARSATHMFSSLTSSAVAKFGFGRTSKAGTVVDIPKIEVHDVETFVDERYLCLNQLLTLNHTNYSVLYNELRFHNHTPHILGSVYLLGGSADHLSNVSKDAAANEGHEAWEDSPSGIALHNYREFFGKREYQQAFVNFFKDQVELQGNDWQAVVEKFLFETGPKSSPNPLPMFNCLTAGLGHSLIHLAYAYELNRRDVAIEALTLAATCYDVHLASLPTSTSPRTYSTTNIFEVVARCASDTRLASVFSIPGNTNLTDLLATPSLVSILLEHFSAFRLTDPTTQFQQTQRLAAALLISNSPALGGHGYDFFLVHLLTSSHAVRILLPFFPPKHHLPLVRQWVLIALVIYIAQLRPLIDPSKHIEAYDLAGRDWAWAEKRALEGKHKFDAHFVKAVRALKEMARVWGDGDEGDGERYFEKAAVRFADEFEGWDGFGE